MKMTQVAACVGALCTGGIVSAHAQHDWHLRSPEKDKIYGAAVYEAAAQLKDKKATPVIVAVIDNGTDINHKALQPYIWVNKDEIPGNGIDDDKNGYIDDVNGWNFLGGKTDDIVHEAIEESRQYYVLRDKYADVDTAGLDSADKAGYEAYLDAQKAYTKQLAEDKSSIKSVEKIVNAYKSNAVVRLLIKAVAGKDEAAQLEDGFEEMKQQAYYNSLNTDSVRKIVVGDDPLDTVNRYYGNNRVAAGNPHHGTHTAGIIMSVARVVDSAGHNIRIMPVRAVPNGDERDKDVANAIRYAVDNGAKVINMSFGKLTSPNQGYVDEAIRYAQSKDVLLVHSAGNSSRMVDSAYSKNFPNPYIDSITTVRNWLEVAANTKKSGKLAAGFSNYGYQSSDLFAPGQGIYSTMPHDKWQSMSGTSMAGPVVAGVAVMLRSYYPQLTAEEVRYILLNSVSHTDKYSKVPGRSKTKANTWYMVRSGGVVNAAQAVDMAAQYQKK